MWTFGAGVLVATPLKNAAGTAITTPSPIQFAILQEVTVEESFESKELYGAMQFPVDIGRGKGKVTLKAKTASVYGELFNAVYYGQTLTSGFETIYADLTGTAIPTTPYTITPTPPASGVYGADMGVTDSTGLPYTRVASGPTTGQYSLAAGVYTFAAADTTKVVYISYSYTNATTPASGKLLTVVNQPMGYQPSFEVDLKWTKNGKDLYVRYPNAVSNKLTMTAKNDDFTIPEFDIDCFADATGNISYRSWYE